MISKARASLVVLGILASPFAASSDIVANPAFDIEGMVIVWSADVTGNAPIVVDFVIADGPTGADLIAGDAFTVVTGSLVSTQDTSGGFGGIPYVIADTNGGDINTDSTGEGVLDGDDAISAFDLNNTANTRVDAVSTRTSFYVASNTAFSINAQLTNVSIPILAFATVLNMEVTLAGDDGIPFGSAAQFPHSGGSNAGFNTPVLLAGLGGGGNVFNGNQRTAAQRGSIVEQSVRFDQIYSVGFAGYDLSLGTFDFDATVVYTVFVP